MIPTPRRHAAHDAQRFAVTPPPGYALAILLALGGVLPLLLIGIALVAEPADADLRKLWPALLIVPLALMLMFAALRRRSVELRDGVLEVRAALFRHRVAATALDLKRARIVDLAERTELRPLLMTNGMSLPGFHAGWFRLREKLGKGFCLLTDRRRVLWLPGRNGGVTLLLSLQQPQQLLDALRDVAPPGRAR